MRLTKELQERIFANLLASHELQERAKAVTLARQQSLLALSRQVIAKEIGGGSCGTQSDVRAYLERIKAACPYGSVLFQQNIYQSVATVNTKEGEPYAYSDNETTVYCGGQRRTLKLNGDVSNEPDIDVSDITPPRFEFSITLPLFDTRAEVKPGHEKYLPYYLVRSCPSLASDHWFALEIDKNDAERRAIRGEFTTFKSTVFAAMSKFTTVKKLVEAWPEINEFLPEPTKPAGTGIAISREDLNAICGLPK